MFIMELLFEYSYLHHHNINGTLLQRVEYHKMLALSLSSLMHPSLMQPAHSSQMPGHRPCEPCEPEEDIHVLMMIPTGTRLPGLRPRHDGRMAWLEDFKSIFTAEAKIETTEGSHLL